jgi:hypothetical protein
VSYSIKNNTYRSHTTGRDYPFIKDRTGASKKAALAKLNLDEKAFRDAKTMRPDPLPADKTHAEIVAEVIHAKQPNSAPVPDMIAQRVAVLERKLKYARTSTDRGSLQRRIAALSERQDKELSRAEAIASREAFIESAAYQQALIEATETCEKLALRADPLLPEQLVRDAFDNRTFLRSNPTPEGLESYFDRDAKLRAEYREGRVQSIEMSKARIAEMQAELRQLKLDPDPELPSETTKEETATSETESKPDEANRENEQQPS